mgnify:CR=1 FL=1
MIQFIVNKIFYGILTLFGVVTVIFLLFNVLPGDPARMMLDQREDSQQLENIRKKYGFDQSITTQYFYYLNDVSPLSFHSKKSTDYTFLTKGKYSHQALFSIGGTTLVLKYPYLRESFQKNGKKVSEVITETLPNTAILALFAIVIAIVFGILFGVLSAVYKDTWFDRIIAVISTFGMSIPSLEILNLDYVRTAKAKGLSKSQVIKKHALKNALNPVVTAISGWFASMLAGAVFVEYIFNWNGLGKEIVNALNTLDLPIIMGSVLVIATLFIIINILVDIMYSWLDPRIRLQ